MSTPETVSQKELARYFRVAPRTIRRWQNYEGLPRRADGTYMVADVLEWYVDRQTAREGIPDLETARARKTAAQARIAELEAAEREGRLMPIEMHGDRLAEVCGRIRERLLALPDRWALQLTDLEDPGEIRDVLVDAVGEALAELQGLAEELEQEAERSEAA